MGVVEEWIPFSIKPKEQFTRFLVRLNTHDAYGRHVDKFVVGYVDGDREWHLEGASGTLLAHASHYQRINIDELDGGKRSETCARNVRPDWE